MTQIIKISEFILSSFVHILPYLLVTIPLAVIINLSGASKYIARAFAKNPIVSVLLATVVGAFSPFCSCGVIPVVFSLLTGGVPLAPVMSFWLASPSMDPEIFFLSTSMLGWKLAVWRLASTFAISLLAGYITHFLSSKGFFRSGILNGRGIEEKKLNLKQVISTIMPGLFQKRLSVEIINGGHTSFDQSCCTATNSIPDASRVNAEPQNTSCSCSDTEKARPLHTRVLREIMKASVMVTKFMFIAFLLTALITFYLPESWMSPLVSGSQLKQVVVATLIGIPMYTSNMTALPLVSGMINLGLDSGAALSFLIAGATTTLPAMAAVWGITKRRVFLLYLLFALSGSLLAGLIFNLFS